jgi:hypothetical protein
MREDSPPDLLSEKEECLDTQETIVDLCIQLFPNNDFVITSEYGVIFEQGEN